MDVRVAILAIGWSAGWFLLWRVPRLGVIGSSRTNNDPQTPVAIVIPARNEELSIGRLLTSLQAQSFRPAEIVVVDDLSTDATAAIVKRYPDVTLVAGEPLPPGWTGKSWACDQGVRSTTAPLLVLLDADVHLDADGLAKVVQEARHRGGLVSVQPYHLMERAYERFSALFNIIGFMGVGAASPRRDGASIGAFGPVLACTRADYERVGGHGGVRSEIVEDLALARAFREHDLPVAAIGGGPSVSFRMYPEGLGQLVEGWSKNFASGAASVPITRMGLVAIWVTAALASVQTVIEQAWGFEGASLVFAATCFAVFAFQFRTMLRQLGNFGLFPVLFYPATLGIFLVVFARSMWLTVVRRQVEWRGRTIPLSAKARHRDGHRQSDRDRQQPTPST